eukprot:Pgem_evm1s17180
MTEGANTITPIQEEKGSNKKKLLGARSIARLSDLERNAHKESLLKKRKALLAEKETLDRSI